MLLTSINYLLGFHHKGFKSVHKACVKNSGRFIVNVHGENQVVGDGAENSRFCDSVLELSSGLPDWQAD